MNKPHPLIREPVLRWLVLSFLFNVAFFLRLYHIGDPPMDIHANRQYHSVLLAKGFYEWLLGGEVYTFPPDGILEPPILELVVSFAYYVLGGVYLWVPRLLSTMFWMIGGILLYSIAKRVTSPNAAAFSVFFYLFVPYSVFASRAFMPDPLMVMTFLLSIFTILRYHEQPTTRRLLTATIASSLAVFIKPIMCLIPIITTFVSLAVHRQGARSTLTDARLLLFMLLSILPTTFYYAYGTFISGFLQAQVGNRVVPQFLLDVEFWQGWSNQIGKVVGYVGLAGALIGFLVVRKGLPRALLIGLWSGYLLFGLVFTYHIHTHDYYSLLFIPVVALSLGPVGSQLVKYMSCAVKARSLSRTDSRYYVVGVSVLTVSILALGLGAAENAPTIRKIANQERATQKYARAVETYQEIGEAVNHSGRTLMLFGDTSDFGYPLMYHGSIYGHPWPYPIEQHRERWKGKPEPTVEERFNTLYSEYSPEYFIISSKWWASEDYEELREFLNKNFTLSVENSHYVIFDLENKG